MAYYEFPAEMPVRHHEIQSVFALVAEHYQKSAPTVDEWADGRFRALNEGYRAKHPVTLLDVALACDIAGYGADGGPGVGWAHPNHAANMVYKHMSEMGFDTTGQAGF